MRVQRGYRSPRNYRRSPRYQSPRNRSPKTNNLRQQNPPIISKMIDLHNRIEGLTSELNKNTKRENDILGRIENIIQMSKLQEIKLLKLVESFDHQLEETASLKTRLDDQQQQLDTVLLRFDTQTAEIMNCDTKITNIIETSLTFFANKLDKNILDQRTLEDKMNKALEEKTTTPEPTPATKDVEEKTTTPEPTPASLSKKPKKRRKKRSIEISLDNE